MKRGKIVQPKVTDLQKLSGGACKVLLALQIEPTANIARLATMTGYSTRQTRTLRREIETLDLAQPQAELSELDSDQDRAYRSLVDFGFDQATARNLAREYRPTVVTAGLRYVKKCSGLDNPRGLLINWLRANRNERYSDGDQHAHAMFWPDAPEPSRAPVARPINVSASSGSQKGKRS